MKTIPLMKKIINPIKITKITKVGIQFQSRKIKNIPKKTNKTQIKLLQLLNKPMKNKPNKMNKMKFK